MKILLQMKKRIIQNKAKLSKCFLLLLLEFSCIFCPFISFKSLCIILKFIINGLF